MTLKRGADRKRGHVTSIKKALAMADGGRRGGCWRDAQWRTERHMVVNGGCLVVDGEAHGGDGGCLVSGGEANGSGQRDAW